MGFPTFCSGVIAICVIALLRFVHEGVSRVMRRLPHVRVPRKIRLALSACVAPTQLCAFIPVLAFVFVMEAYLVMLRWYAELPTVPVRWLYPRAMDLFMRLGLLFGGVTHHLQGRTSFNWAWPFRNFSSLWCPDVTSRFVEDCACLTLELVRARNKTDIVFAVYNFWRKTSQKSLFDTSQETISKFVDDLFPTTVELQGWESDFKRIKSLRDDIKQISGSENFVKLKRILLYALSTDALAPFGCKNIAKNAIFEDAFLRKSLPEGRFETIEFIFDSLIFITEVGFQVSHGASPYELFHSSRGYQEVLMRLKHAEQQAFLVASGDTTSDQYEGDHALIMAIDALLIETREIYDRAKQLGKREALIAQDYYHRAQRLVSEMHGRVLSRSIRKMPYMVLFQGTSGVGKSQLTEIVFRAFGGWHDLTVDKSLKYKVDPTAKYWNGFDSSMWCVVLDDIAFRHPKSMQGGDPTVDVIIPLGNTTPFAPDQAAIEKKDQAPCRAELVIGTTNIKDMNVRSYYSYPRAALRRFPYVITPIVKDAYQTNGQLDPPVGTTHQDFWTFKVEKVDVTAGVPTYTLEHAFDSISDLLVWMKKNSTEHRDKQERTMAATEQLYRAGMCVCGVPDNLPCRCPPVEETTQEVQGLEVPTVSTLFLGAMFYHFFRMIFDLLPRVSVATYVYYKSLGAWKKLRSRFYFDRERSFIALGDRVRDVTFRYPSALVAFTAILLGGYMATKLFSHMTALQGNEGSVPRPHDHERSNPWYSSNLTTSKLEGDNALGTTAYQDLVDVVGRNTVLFTTSSAKINGEFRGLALFENTFLINNHVIKDEVEDVTLHAGPHNQVGEVLTVKLLACRLTRFPDRDLAILTIPNARHFKDIRSFFPDEISGYVSGVLCRRLIDGSVKKHGFAVGQIATHSIADLGIKIRGVQTMGTYVTQEGDCGSPYVVQMGKKRCIAGIHTVLIRYRYGGDQMLSNLVTTADIERMCAESAVQPAAPDLGYGPYEVTLQSLHHKSPFRWIPNGTASIYGSLSGFRSTPVSCVSETLLKNLYLQLGGVDPKFGKPQMKGWKPWRIGALDMTSPVTGFKFSDLEWAKADYLAHLRKHNVDTSSLHSYTTRVALNGAPGVAFVDPINKKTSAGFPWRKRKTNFLVDAPCDKWPDGVDVTPEIKARIEAIESRYAQGTCFHPIFTASLKDEPVSEKKQKSGKTRIFCGAPLDWTIVVRKLFLSHIRLIHNNKFVFECAVGTAAQGYEWEKLYQHVTKFGTDRIVAGDYASFDKSMPPSVISAAFDILISLARDSGNFSQEELTMMECVSADTAYPTVDFHGDLVRFWGSNPSGHPLTVVINSIANSLYMRMAFRNIVGDQPFSESVSLMTYGDDNIMSVEDTIDFNHTVIAKYFSDVGITYTMADKEAESIPFINIRDASFLKRTWRYDPLFACHLAPLEEKSIHKMLCYTVISKEITHEEQCFEILHSALDEYFQYGREVFDVKREMLILLSQRAGLSSFRDRREFLTWERYVERYADTSDKNLAPHPFLS